MDQILRIVLLMSGAVFVIAGLVLVYSLCALSAALDQRDEDEYGVERARRS